MFAQPSTLQPLHQSKSSLTFYYKTVLIQFYCLMFHQDQGSNNNNKTLNLGGTDEQLTVNCFKQILLHKDRVEETITLAV